MNNSALGQRLIALWQLLQRRETTFSQIIELSAKCGIDGRQVLADHFAAYSRVIIHLEA